MNSPFIELQSYSNYSFLRGASHPEELISEAARLGYRAIGISDYHSFAGIVRAHVAAKKHKLQLIIGTRIPLFHQIPTLKSEQQNLKEPLEVQAEQLRPFTLPLSVILYPSSKEAYGRICALLTKGKLRAPKGMCFLKLQELADASIATHCLILPHDLADTSLLHHLERLKTIFPQDRLSLALSHTYGPEGLRRLEQTLLLSRVTNIATLATNEVHYHSASRRELQDVLTCIRSRSTITEAGFRLFQNNERFLKPPEEIARLFRKYPEALRRTAEVAEATSNFSLDQLRYEYPHEVCPQGEAPLRYLQRLVEEQSPRIYPEGVPAKVQQQIEHELKLIEELDYAKYFLTVYDIVCFARKNKILCQGRGAAANSAVCYVLGITSVDPDRINLLFERFISKERNEPPDIDIDFEHERREEVIQYIYQKYGRHRAALTAALITYRTRSAVRDVGKVFDLAEKDIIALIKLFTRSEDEEFSSEDLLARDLNPDSREIQHTIRLVKLLRGFPRHLSQHVGGFIISEYPLSKMVPIENAAMPNRTVIEWDKDDIEALGMLKIDILALGMLTMIRKAFDLINARASEERKIPSHILQLHSIPPEDEDVYNTICRADTIGVFQIESRAQQSMLPRLRPRCFYDLVIEVAIVRPGPIQGGMVHPYLKRRSGQEKVIYPSDAIRRVLEPTLGVPIFQEQVMELAVVAAGFTPGEADQIRRAMGSWKRNKNALTSFGKKLTQGMQKNGYSLAFAERIFEQIKGFGEYGFPQSHAASFALLVYVSAWLKHHHHAAFTAALLNSQPMGFYRPAQLIADAKAHGVIVKEVDVMHSSWDCTLEGKGSKPALRLGMRLLKGLRLSDAESIRKVVQREDVPLSLTELWKKSKARADAFRHLARADAFRSLGLDRQAALWEAGKLRDDSLPLFAELPEIPDEKVSLPAFHPKEQVVKDYQTKGFSLKAHPVSFLRQELKADGVYLAAQIKQEAALLRGLRVTVAGIILLRQRPMTAAGTVFMTLEDESGMCNLIIRPKVFQQFHDTLCDSVFLLAYGKVQFESGVLHLLGERFRDISARFSQVNSVSRDFR